jgi:hypothetical protein
MPRELGGGGRRLAGGEEPSGESAGELGDGERGGNGGGTGREKGGGVDAEGAASASEGGALGNEGGAAATAAGAGATALGGALVRDGRGAALGLLAAGRGGANTGREIGAGPLLVSVFADSVGSSGRGFSSPIRDVRTSALAKDNEFALGKGGPLLFWASNSMLSTRKPAPRP